MRTAFLLYPTHKVKIDEDSSFWIMRELLRRGHKVFYFESKHLFWKAGAPRAFLTPAKLDLKKGYLSSSIEKEPTDLSSLNCIFIRKEPPFNNEYLYALQLLDMIKARVFILNDPAGIAMANEKLFSLFFEKYTPETIVTSDPIFAAKSIKDLKDRAIIKPLHEKGGAGIFLTSPRDSNLPSLLATATDHGSGKIMIQRYIPANRYGDKRVLILNGKILGAFLRRPPATDFRANLSVGGTMHRCEVNPRDREIVSAIAPKLLSYGLLFVGIDIIGKYLTEINVTSPAGIPEINFFNKTHLETQVVDLIEQKAKRAS